MAIDGNVLESFFVSLGFVVDKKGVEEWEQKMEGLRSVALKLGGVLTAAAAGAALFVEHVAKNVGEMNHLAKVNHLTTTELQAFNAIARENSIDVGAMQQGIFALNARLGQAQLGTGRLLPILKRLGISVKDTQGNMKGLDQILADVADKMQKLSPSQRLGLAQRLGIDPGMVLLLERGGKAWQQMFSRAKTDVPITAEQAETAEKTEKLFEKARHEIEVLWDLLAFQLMPKVNELLQRFNGWLTDQIRNRTSAFNQALRTLGGTLDWISERWNAISEVVMPLAIFAIGLWVASFIPALISIGTAIAAFCTNAIAWFTAFSIAELIALWPIEAIMIAIALLAVVIYELWDHWKPISKFFADSWDWILKKIKAVGDYIEDKLRPIMKFLHLDIPDSTVTLVRKSMNDTSSPQWNATGNQLWGATTSHSRSMVFNDNRSIPNITVVSPDPEKAGEKVREALRPDRDSAVRNALGTHF